MLKPVPGVSVIVPTYNRAEMLATTAPSYLSCDELMEFIVVDDGSSDRTTEIVEDLAVHDSRVRYVRLESNRGMQIARNMGARLATGEWLLFTEDDLALGKDYLAILLRCLQDSGADIASGRRVWMRIGETEEQGLQRADRDQGEVNDLRWLEHNSHARPRGVAEVPLLSGTMLVRRAVFEHSGFFDGYAGNSWREETDFQLSALEQGYRLIYCPDAVAFHHARSAISFGADRLRGDLRYLYWIFRNNLLFLKRHEAFIRVRFPRALILGSPLLTSLLYSARRALWLIKTEGLRLYLSRRHQAFRWR